MPAGETHRGSCLCGRVTYEIKGAIGPMSNCYCTDCRKSHGAAFASYIGVERKRLTFLQGESELGEFTTETGTRRNFCRRCGSSLTGTVKSEPDTIYLAAGTFDTPLRLKPEYHIFIRSKAPWLDLHDGLPQHQEFAE